MSYDITELWELITGLVAAPGDITRRMRKLIDFCASALPHDQWTTLRGIDFDMDNSRHSAWRADLYAVATTGEKPRGLWFGLANPVRNGNATLDIYCAARPNFDSDGIAWAQHIDRSAVRFLGSRVLAEIYSSAYATQDSLGNEAEYPLALGFGAMTARAVLEAGPLTASLDQIAGAAIGFDSGDFMYLGEAIGGAFNVRARSG